jgi:outer membrane lipoprotein-sorting protein
MIKLFLLCILCFSIPVFSQPDPCTLITGTAKTTIEKQIVAASGKIVSLQCKFTQEKASVLLAEKAYSKGILLYKAPASLRWEYTEPTKYALILHAETVYLKNEQGIVSNSNKMFKQLAHLIITTINGNGLLENENFKSEVYQSEKDKTVLWIKLIPIPKRLKDVYSSIQIKIRTSDYLASEIILEEKSGDRTTITLIDKKMNSTIDEKRFSIN